MNPIWNAVSNSLVTNAGSRIENGTSLPLAKVPPPAISVNIIRFASRVWRSMKAWNASPACADRDIGADRARRVGRNRVGVHQLHRRRHHEQRQEQREACQHLPRG